MRLIDDLTATSLAAHEPKVWVAVLFERAWHYNGAHVGCYIRDRHLSSKVIDVWLAEEGDEMADEQRCYYCERLGQIVRSSRLLKPF